MDVFVQAGRDSDTHFESEMSYDAQMRGQQPVTCICTPTLHPPGTQASHCAPACIQGVKYIKPFNSTALSEEDPHPLLLNALNVCLIGDNY